jgi:hypothetical protein
VEAQPQEEEETPMTADMTGMAELPQFGIGVTPPENDPKMWLTIQYGTAEMSFYLCDTSNYEEAARKIHKIIMDAGVSARRMKTGIIAAQGDVNINVRPAQGRK